MPREGILFVLVGPSGAGKNTLMKRVLRQFDNLQQLATATTRAKRAGEQDGREHMFVSHAGFQALIDADALVEWQPVHLNDLYGTPRQAVDDALNAGRDLIADIEFLGAGKLQEAYPDNAVLIFVTPSNLDILAERITQRGHIAPEALVNRLARARFEMTFAPRCNYLILNDEVEPAADYLRQIIASERIRRRGSTTDHAPALPRHVFHVTVTALIQDKNRQLIPATSPDTLLPAFPITDHSHLPHEFLRRQIKLALDHEVSFESISDSRFDFVAPAQVTIAATPPDVYLDFYYRCSLHPPQPENISESS